MSLLKSTVRVASNVWIDVEMPHNPYPAAAARHMPGDLRVEMLDVNTRDADVLRLRLTDRQMEEFLAYRHFLHHGQTGLAFDDLRCRSSWGRQS